MVTIEAQTRKWGNSIVVIIPAEIVTQQHIQENERVVFKVEKKKPLAGEMFGFLKGWNKPAQQIKDEARAGWLSASDREREEEWKKKQKI